MPVIPSSNQTLILASERSPAGRATATVTILAARPDNTLLYLRADYSSAAESSVHLEPSSSATAARNVVASTTGMPVAVSPRTSGTGSRYAANRGIELYASTQNTPAATSGTHIDVQA